MSSLNYSIEHIGLASADTTALAEWYVRHLKGTIVFDNGEAPPALFVKLPGGLIMEIYPAASRNEEVTNNGLAGFRHLALQVDSLEASAEALRESGLELTEAEKPAGGGGRVLFFSDLEGNLIHLVERPDGSQFNLPRP